VGVPEASKLLTRATRLAEAATRQELLDSLLTATGGASAPLSAADAALGREALLRVWTERGASAPAAERLANACEAAGGRLATAAGAAAKLSQMRRLLPGTDVVALAARDDRVLTRTNASSVVQNLCSVAVALPRVDPVALLAEHPPLLWAEDLAQKLETCMNCFRRWSPTSDVQQLIEAHPALIERIPAFYAGFDFFQLPLELQNAMAVGGGGGGVHYRSWGGFEDRNTD
jgi:hypothetical protein